MRKILISLLLVTHPVVALGNLGGGSSIGPAWPPNAPENCSLLGGELRAMDSEGHMACVVNEPALFSAMEKRGLVKANEDPSRACKYWDGTQWNTLGSADCIINPMSLGSLN